MAKVKKRLSKKAKAAKRILENSKLLDSSPSGGKSDTTQTAQPDAPLNTNTTAHKARPNKKRG